MAITIKTDVWLQYWQRKPHARIRLFCFPYAGGGASIFRSWSEQLPQDIEVCPVQLPGRENRLLETPFSSTSSLLDALAPALLPYLDMPYAFFGHSMGSLISFELARRLSDQQIRYTPVRLFMSGHRAPQLPDPDPPTYHLPEPAFIEELRRLQGTSEEVLQNTELLRLLMPLLRADFTLCETYKYIHAKPLNIPILAFGGLQDTSISRDEISAWREQTCAPFTLRFFTGNHYFLRGEELPKLLQTISREISTPL